MWRSRSPVLLRWSIRQKFLHSLPNHSALCKPLPQVPFKWYTSICPGVQNTKFLSSATESSPKNNEVSHTLVLEAKCSSVAVGESGTFLTGFGDDAEDAVSGLNEKIDGEDDRSTSLVESIVSNAPTGADKIGEVVAVVPKVNIDQLERVESILRRTLPPKIGSILERLPKLVLTEEFVVRVFQDANVPGKNLVTFFRWAIEKTAAVKSSRALLLLIQNSSASNKTHKMEAYMLWDLIKEYAKTEGIVTTEMLNQLISIFWKLGKPKAGLEVFDKLDDFSCAPDGNTYYFTIEALGKKKSMIATAWSVCEKMLNSGCLPDAEKIGQIITLFCKGKKAKEAHLVYLHAKENNVLPRREPTNFLIAGLCSNDEYVYLALELLEEYMKRCMKRSARYEQKTFSLVVQSLTRINDAKAAKVLLLRMVDSGPLPGKSAFNFVITGLCKEGEVEDAVALTKLMESRGLMPDVYTYSIIMSGFAKAGLMDEAFNIFCQAKKRHKVLTPVTYHILIRGYCRIEEYGKALECLKDMKKHGVQPNSDEYSKLIKTLCLKALDWRTAEELSVEMKESGLQLKGATQSLIVAVKMLEEEEIAAVKSK